MPLPDIPTNLLGVPAATDERTGATAPSVGEVRAKVSLAAMNGETTGRSEGQLANSPTHTRAATTNDRSIKPLVVAIALVATLFVGYIWTRGIYGRERAVVTTSDERGDPFELLGRCTTLECVSALHPRLQAAGAKFNYPHFFLAGWQKAGTCGRALWGIVFRPGMLSRAHRNTVPGPMLLQPQRPSTGTFGTTPRSKFRSTRNLITSARANSGPRRAR